MYVWAPKTLSFPRLGFFIRKFPKAFCGQVFFMSYMFSITMKKMVFYNWPCNSIFELHKTFAIHYNYTLWVLINKSHESQSCNSPYKYNAIHYYSIIILSKQLILIYYATPL